MSKKNKQTAAVEADFVTDATVIFSLKFEEIDEPSILLLEDGTVLVNGAECKPGVKKDDARLAATMHEFFSTYTESVKNKEEQILLNN